MKNILMLCWCVAAAAGIWGCVPQQNSSRADTQKEVQVHYQMGINYLAEGKSPQAIKELLSAQSLAPSNADIEHGLGLGYQQKGLYDKAIEQYRKALKLEPKLTEARNNLGTAFLAKGQYDEAIAEFEQCLKDPVYSTPDKAAYNIGVAYLQQKGHRQGNRKLRKGRKIEK